MYLQGRGFKKSTENTNNIILYMLSVLSMFYLFLRCVFEIASVVVSKHSRAVHNNDHDFALISCAA
jgi:hypothetical protein